MSKKRLRRKPGPQAVGPYVSPRSIYSREPEHTATFWRNSYEHERQINQLMHMELMSARKEIDRLTK